MTTGYVSTLGASEETPKYRIVEENHGATPTYMVVCDEGWRESIVCNKMYGWAAIWLVDQIQGKPFAPRTRPGKSGMPVPKVSA